MAHYLACRQDALWKGALAGAIGGLAGSGAMKLSQRALSQSAHDGSPISPQQFRDDRPPSADPTVKVAAEAAKKIVRKPLSPVAGRRGGVFVHYAFGAGVGALYGAVAELAPATSYAAGAPLGAALWVAADLGATPALGLSKPPGRVPVKRHIQMLGMHLLYGLATDGVRRCLRRRF